MLFWEKSLWIVVLGAVLSASVLAAAEKNLAPPVTAIKNEETGETGDSWIKSRNAAANAIFSVENKALKIEIASDSGYAYYRIYKELKPDTDYTVAAEFKGRTTERANWEIYSFDKGGKPLLIGMALAPAGAVSPTMLTTVFKVPADSVKIRIGAGFSGRGVGWFKAPALYEGKVEISAVPAAAQGATAMTTAPTEWVAEWIWQKENPDAPRASFSKEFTLNENPVCAVVQVTADDGYTLTVNDQQAGADMDWKTVEKIDITTLLKKGTNRIKLNVVNFGGPGGCILQGHIWDRNGKMQTLKTDNSWKMTMPGVAEKVPDVLGVPPVQPWGPIRLQPFMPAACVNVELITGANQVKAGEIFTMVLRFPAALPADEVNSLKLEFYDTAGNRCVLSAYDAIMRYDPSVNQLSVELPISNFTAVGEYTWRLSGVTMNVIPGNQTPTITISNPTAKLERPPASHFPKIATNVMDSSGGKQAPFTYSTFTPKLQSFFNWTHTGGHMYEAFFSAGYRTSDGKCDLSQLETEILQILEADPNASIYLKLQIDVPGWWGFKNPDEIFLSNRNRSALQSFCSEVWRQETVTFVNGLVKNLRSKPAGVAIAGVLLMGFRGGEFQLWGEDVGEYDCSAAAKKTFAAWQKDHSISPEIPLPHPALEWPFKNGDGYDRIRQVYFRFVSERNADNIIYFASEFKKMFGNNYSFGVYFGYPMEHSNDVMRMLYSGHLGVAKVLSEAPLDLISCPASYNLRRMNQSHAYMYPVDSAFLHGIMPIIENDIRNYVVPYEGDSSGPTLLTLKESLTTNRKLNLLAASHGTVVRYLGLLEGCDFFTPLPIIEGIAADNQLMMKLKPAPLGMKEQVAMIIDPLSWVGIATTKFNNSITDNISQLRDLLMRTGRSAAFITSDDWEKNSGRWETAVVPLPGLLSDARLKALSAIFGPLPALKPLDGFLVLRKNQSFVTSDTNALWDTLALPEAKSTGIHNVWYVGGNFIARWDGQKITLKMK